MMGSDDKKSIYNRSYSTSTNFPIKPNRNSSSIQRSESFKKSPPAADFESSIKGKVRNICSLFESRKTSKFRLPGTEDRVVIYFTSLRGIRRTYEDCYSVRMILKFFRVFIDERDVSMDSSYRKELVSVLGANNKQITLPQVFIKGNYVGGVDVIKNFHENGQLAKLINGLPVRSIAAACQVCDTCGDVRFVPCVNCCGSKKVFDEDDHHLKRCPDCNENGLIRCPTCCS